MRVLDLFSGIGGLSLGLERAGMTVVAHSEIDPYACRVLRKHWPDVPNLGDIRFIFEVAYPGEPATISETGPKEDHPMAGRLKKLKQDQVDEAVRMYDAGLSVAPIAEFYGVTRQSMYGVLKIRTQMRPQLRFGSDNHFHRGGIRADDPAQNLAEKAVARGVIERLDTCETCGRTLKFKDGRNGVQAHHDDYNRPLDVRWLCQPCHHEWHKHNTAIPKHKEGQEVPRVDLICGGFP